MGQAADSDEVVRLTARVAALEDERARLEQGAALLAPILATIPIIVVRFDHALRITYVNRYLPELSPETVLGRPLFDFVVRSSHEVARTTIERVLATGVPDSYESLGQGAHESVAHYQTNVVPMDDAEGKVGGCLAVTDVTAVKRRERAVADSEEILKPALAATGIGLWSWEVENNVVTWDARMLQITGRSEAATLEEYAERVAHPDDREGIASDGPRVLAGEAVERVHRIVRPDGEVRWVMAMARNTGGADGRPAIIVGGLLDITDQRRLEDQVRHAQRITAVGTLTAGVAHNFNNLLTVILPSFELLRAVVPSSHQGILADAAGAAARAADLVHQLMTYAGKRPPRAQSERALGPVVERCVSMCVRAFDGGIALVCHVDPAVASATVDATDVDQVLMNLLLNARDAVLRSGRPAPRIDVSVGRAAGQKGGERLFARVTDNGGGMSLETLQRAFEPFFTTKGLGAGTGLGLATSLAIARDLGGTVELESQPTVGTSATLWLPARTRGVAGPQRASAAASASRGAHILIVDDDVLVLRTTARLLEIKGHEVRCAEDVAGALAAATADIDVVLLDRSLDKTSGTPLVARLRELAPAARIYFFTGNELSPEEAAQADGVIPKPVRTADLLATINASLAPR